LIQRNAVGKQNPGATVPYAKGLFRENMAQQKIPSGGVGEQFAQQHMEGDTGAFPQIRYALRSVEAIQNNSELPDQVASSK
jgi:hypothetical protein